MRSGGYGGGSRCRRGNALTGCVLCWDRESEAAANSMLHSESRHTPRPEGASRADGQRARGLARGGMRRNILGRIAIPCAHLSTLMSSYSGALPSDRRGVWRIIGAQGASGLLRYGVLPREVISTPPNERRAFHRAHRGRHGALLSKREQASVSTVSHCLAPA